MTLEIARALAHAPAVAAIRLWIADRGPEAGDVQGGSGLAFAADALHLLPSKDAVKGER